MNSVLLTWNPGPFNDHAWTPQHWNDGMVAELAAGRAVRTTWSVGRHVNNIEPGDAAYMFRQGDWGRGIVARGIIRSHPWEGEHWARDGETTHYVDIDWQEAVPTEIAIEVEELEEFIPEFGWRRVYASGRRVTGNAEKKLAHLWAGYVKTEYVAAHTALYTSDVWRNVVALGDLAND